jgi:hypothetical protein
VRVEDGHRVAVHAVCRSHAERILDADRRGDVVSTDGWVVAAGGDARLDLGRPSCEWLIAVRARDEGATVVAIETASSARELGADAPDRWVAIDDLHLEGAPLEEGVALVLATDAWRRTVVTDARAGHATPLVAVLAPDERLSLRAERRERGEVTTIAIAEVPLDTRADTRQSVTLSAADGRPLATLGMHVRTRRVEAIR